MTSSETTIEKDFSLFFTDPIAELNKLNKDEANTQKKKKQIVIDVASRLELKENVPRDTICRIMIKHLDGVVSARLVRECLPNEYKQEYKSENAKRQKKLRPENSSIGNLAAVAT